MWNTIKSMLVKVLLTKTACGWIIKTALNAALAKATNPEKREKTCNTLTCGADLMTTTASACKDGKVDDDEADAIEAKGIVFGEALYDLIKG